MVKKSKRQRDELDLKPIGELLTDQQFIDKIGVDLFNNVTWGNTSGVQHLLSSPPLNESPSLDEVKNLVALFAATKNQVIMLRHLMIQGVLTLTTCFDGDKRSALHYAAHTCQAQAVQFLLYEAELPHDAEDVLGYTPFEYACAGGDIDCMDLILDKAKGNKPPPPLTLPPPDPPMMAAAPPSRAMRSMMRAPTMIEPVAPSMMECAPPMMSQDSDIPSMAPQMRSAVPEMDAPAPLMMRRSREAPLAMRSVVDSPRAVKKSNGKDEVPKKFFLQSLVLAARKGNTRAVMRLMDEASVVKEARAGLGSGRNSLLHLLGRRISAQELGKLADCGLDITSRNTSGVRAFEEVPPLVLQQFLDLSVSSAPECIDLEHGVTEAYTVRNPFLNTDHPDLDMSTLIEISNSTVHTKLIFHPLFFGICAIKWRFIRKFFWLVAFLAFAFAIFTSWVTVTRVRKMYSEEQPEVLTRALINPTPENILYCQIVTCSLLLILVITEISNMLLHNLYVYVARYLAIMASLVILFLLLFVLPSKILQENAYFAIFIPWFFLMYHICQHYSFAQYYSNFIQISKTSLKIVFVFGSIPVAFSLVFHVMLISNDQDNGGESKAFDYLYSSILRTIAMMIGDMAMDDFSEQFTSFQWSVTYLFFILGVALVLYNMINALAVSDTQKLNDKAEIFRIIALTRQILTGQNWLRMASRLPFLAWLRVPIVRDFTVECRNYRWKITAFTCELGGKLHQSQLGIMDQDDQDIEPKLTLRERRERVALSCNAKFVRDLKAIAAGTRTLE